MADKNRSDKDLLVLLMKQEDTGAFCEIYERYWSSMYNGAFKRLKDKNQCQDIVQNVFMDLWNRRETLNIKNLSGFLHTAVKFQVFKLVSRKQEQPAFFDLIQIISTSPFQADGKIIENELQELLEKFLLTLPESRRKIFVMHYLEDLSTRQIASQLNISQKTVQNQLNTAEKQLKQRLTQFLALVILGI